MNAIILPIVGLPDILEKARSFLTESDVKLLRESDLDTAIASLHFTLGAQFRAAFNLWEEKSFSLQAEIFEKSGYPVIDADSASAGLIALLWREINT